VERRTAHAVDPLSGDAANLTPEQQKLVLGGEATMWSEYVNGKILTIASAPTAAIAETLLVTAISHRREFHVHASGRDQPKARMVGLTHPQSALENVASHLRDRQLQKSLQH